MRVSDLAGIFTGLIYSIDYEEDKEMQAAWLETMKKTHAMDCLEDMLREIVRMKKEYKATHREDRAKALDLVLDEVNKFLIDDVDPARLQGIIDQEEPKDPEGITDMLILLGRKAEEEYRAGEHTREKYRQTILVIVSFIVHLSGSITEKNLNELEATGHHMTRQAAELAREVCRQAGNMY